LACNSHHKTDEWCWKPAEPPFNGKKCIPLNAADLLEWASAIKDNVATKFAPPVTATFWNKKKASSNSGLRHRRKSDEPPSYVPSPVVIQLNDRHYPQTPRRPRATSFTVSPVRGFPPEHYNSDGLLAYLEYLARSLRDDAFLDLYPILNNFRMGIDLFKSSTVTIDGAKQLLTELKEDCGITIGMARRLVENFQAWHKTLPARQEIRLNERED
jgi:hypothetical protein